MRADDGHFYVVKFQNNPQHLRVLANELLATRLAESVGLPVPITEIVIVQEWLIKNTPELRVDLAGLSSHCKPGLQFGARYVCDPAEGQVFDYLPESMFAKVKNLAALPVCWWWINGWETPTDGRPCSGRKPTSGNIPRRSLTRAIASMPENGISRTRPCAAFMRATLSIRTFAAGNHLSPGSAAWRSMDPAVIHEIAGAVPPAWTGNDWGEMERLAAAIVERRSKVRELITAFRDSTRQPFPSWRQAAEVKATANRPAVQ